LRREVEEAMRLWGKIANFLALTGRRVIAFFSGYIEFQHYLKSIFNSFKSLKYLRMRSLYSTVLLQTKYTGLDAVFLISVVALMLGATVIIQASQKFPKFGIDSFIGDLLVLIIIREIGPLATAMIVTSRSGSAISAEIATQKQNHEIRSLELLGIDTKLYIVFPRIIATILSIISLVILFDVVALAGGYLISRLFIFIPPQQFLATIINAFSFEDLLITFLKSLMYGILIPLICCYYGFRPTSAFQIPIFVSRAVVRTLLSVFIVNALISFLFYL
jgi:phospholipid/cholesterol/gamma-HCH transport system permease protein